MMEIRLVSITLWRQLRRYAALAVYLLIFVQPASADQKEDADKHGQWLGAAIYGEEFCGLQTSERARMLTNVYNSDDPALKKLLEVGMEKGWRASRDRKKSIGQDKTCAEIWLEFGPSGKIRSDFVTR